MKWSNKHIWRCPIKAEKCYTHGRHDGKHHKVELLTAATVTLLGAHRCFWCKYCHFWAAWYSGSPYSEEWTVMMVYSRNNLQLSLLLNYTSKRKKKTLPSASTELNMSFKRTVLLHSHYIYTTYISYCVKSSGAILEVKNSRSAPIQSCSTSVWRKHVPECQDAQGLGLPPALLSHMTMGTMHLWNASTA